MRNRHIAAVLVVAAVALLAPQELTDPDTLSRLAVGRFIVDAGELPATDPFTFAQPQALVRHPEWLGDVALFGMFHLVGPGALQLVVLLLALLGLWFALSRAVSLKAEPTFAAAWMMVMLPLCAPRFAARNDLHALWLTPLFVLLLSPPPFHQPPARSWWLLLALGALWGNLHASFFIGWGLLLARLVAQWLSPAKPSRVAWFVCAIFPFLPVLGPSGFAPYEQVIDHLTGTNIYRAYISEWRAPFSASGWLATLPLYMLVGGGAIALTAVRGRMVDSVFSIASFAIGAALALSSRRFGSFALVLAIPPATAAMWLFLKERPGTIRRTLLVLGAVVCTGYMALAVFVSRRQPTRSIFDPSAAVVGAATFLSRHAPAGAKVFNSFNDGPWLLWLTAPRVQHYWDPRNHLGASFIEHVMSDVLPDPTRFEQDALRLGTSFVLISESDPFQRRLAEHLSHSREWPLVYWDGQREVRARAIAENSELIAQYGYYVLRPTLDAAYWDSVVQSPALESDLERLSKDAPNVAAAIRQRTRKPPP